MGNKVRVLVVGVGNMGLSHAKAYKSIEGFELVLGQFVFLGQETQPREGELPEEAFAPAVRRLQTLLEDLHRPNHRRCAPSQQRAHRQRPGHRHESQRQQGYHLPG